MLEARAKTNKKFHLIFTLNLLVFFPFQINIFDKKLFRFDKVEK